MQKKKTLPRCVPAPIMRHFRKKSSSSSPANSRPPTPVPPAEYIKRELATFYPRSKDQRALAASSSAIALSIASASCNPIDIALDEARSGWMTAYGAAKIAVEAAKECSDMLPPLKAVLSALSVLIKNCDASISCSSHPVDCLPCIAANHRQYGTNQRHRGKDTVAR